MFLVFRVKDRPTTGNQREDAKNLRAGDLIAPFPDSHVFSAIELSNPDWRIVNISDIPVEDVKLLTATDDYEDTTIPEPKVRRNRLDIHSPQLPKPFRDYVDDDARVNPIYDAGAVWTTILKPYIKAR